MRMTYQQLFSLMLVGAAAVIGVLAWAIIIRDLLRDLRRWHRGDWPYWLRRMRRRRWRPRPLRFRVNLLSPARPVSWLRRVVVTIRVRS